MNIRLDKSSVSKYSSILPQLVLYYTDSLNYSYLKPLCNSSKLSDSDGHTNVKYCHHYHRHRVYYYFRRHNSLTITNLSREAVGWMLSLIQRTVHLYVVDIISFQYTSNIYVNLHLMRVMVTSISVDLIDLHKLDLAYGILVLSAS